MTNTSFNLENGIFLPFSPEATGVGVPGQFTTWSTDNKIGPAGTPSGALLDQLTGFSSTGILQRTGAGAYSFLSTGTSANNLVQLDGSGVANLTGGAIVPTRTRNDSTTNAASTAFVQAELVGNGIVLDASKFPGANVGEKIQACVNALPVFGGVCDARNLANSGTINSITISKPGVTILGPCGFFTVNGTINIGDGIHGMNGFSWLGCGASFGANATAFFWQGNSTDPMFRLRAVRDSVFKDFTISAISSAPLAEGLRMETCQAAGVATRRMFHNILIFGNLNAALIKGMRWCIGNDAGGSGTDGNNDLDYIENVNVGNYTNTAFSLEGTQVKTLVFNNCSFFGGGARGVATTQATNSARNAGSFRWYGGGGGACTVADFDLGAPSDNILIQGANTESSNRLLQTGPSAGSSHWPISIIGCRFSGDALNADNNVIFYQLRGPIVVMNNLIELPGGSASVPKFNISTSGLPARGVAIGNSVTTATAAATTQPFIGGSGAEWEIIGNLVRDNSGGAFPIVNQQASNPLTVANLPTSPAKGFRAFVTDQATATAYLGSVTGGGSTNQWVVWDGATWKQA